MTIKSALEEIAANDEKRKRAASANEELQRLFNEEMPKLHARLNALAEDCGKFNEHISTLLEGQSEDLNDEPLSINLGEK